MLILTLLILFQGLQFFYPVISVKPLKGVIPEPKIHTLTFSGWLNEDFQDHLTDFVDYNFGFRPFLIRIYNQLQFSLYKQAHGEAIVVGKKNFLFQEHYIDEYLGKYFIGREKADTMLTKLSEIRKYFKRYNTEILVVLTPGKPYYYPEYIPEYYKSAITPSNYALFKKSLASTDIPVFDVNGWFMQLKQNGDVPPLFTQTGTHWSNYGAKLTADSLIRLSSRLLDRPMNLIHLTDVEWTDSLRKPDDDLEKLMNIFCKVNKLKAAYPVYTADTAIAINKRPAIIVDADSFFWNLFDGILNNSFRSVEYWYYYSSVYPDYYYHDTHIKDISVPINLMSADLVILMTSTSGLHKMGFGLIDDVYRYVSLSNDQKLDTLIADYYQYITKSEDWMENIAAESTSKKHKFGFDAYTRCKIYGRTSGL